MGKESQFGGVIQHAMDHTMRRPIERNFANLARHERWLN
jgi:hypothetical protein